MSNKVKNSRLRVKNTAFLAISATLALLLSYVEFLLPPLFASVPGIKLGLPNTVIIYVLYSLGVKYAFAVSATRLLLSSILFGNTVTLAYSAAGAVLSLAIMAILKRLSIFSEVGVSVAGGVLHNLGQILVAVLLLDTPAIAYYMIVLTVTGTLTGALIGIIGAVLVKRIPIETIRT